MILKTNILMAGRSLYATKQRSFLALVGIMVGIGSVIAMVSVGTIAKHKALQQFKELGTDVLLVQRLHSSSGQRTTYARKGFSLEEAVGLSEEIPSIAATALWARTFGESVYAGEKVMEHEIVGTTESLAGVGKLRLDEGRFISDLDFRRFYCVVGAELAENLRKAGARQLIGEPFKLAGHTCTIVGVLRASSTSTTLRRFDPNQTAFMPLSTVRRVFPSAEARYIIARMDPSVHYTVVEAEVREYFRRKAPDAAIRVRSAQDLIERMEQQMQLFALLLAAIGSICLIVGGVGVMNVMLVSVTERRMEIGIRRALGARQRDIQSQFLIESVILSLFGGVFGVLLGVGTTYIICRFFTDWAFLVDPTAVLTGVVVAFCVGVFFGFYPAYQAARLNPITALRAQ